ncbi:MAG: ABC transporter substrate-binding protein [Opitutales bacterium]|nr:ABC transporter substrate-binding protein [Opitutales bacterium]
MRKKFFLIFLAIALVIALPFLFRRPGISLTQQTDDTVVILTPHNESIRLELELGFRDWYFQRTQRTVKIDWRVPGSTNNCIRVMHTSFENAFQQYWEQTLHRTWDATIQEGFRNPTPKNTAGKEAREAFLASNISCGMDLFFGGGIVEFKKEAEIGHFVPCDLQKRHPEWFQENCIPATIDGDSMYDPQGRWYPTSLASFGMMYNTDRIRDLQIPAPQQWEDLTQPAFYHQIAMVDPVQSSVVVKCFEMILQQQMQQVRKEILQKTGQTECTPSERDQMLNEGWLRGFRLIQKIMANARYFTDNSITTVWDVNQGNCAAGIVVDFYGRHQRSVTRQRSGSDRIRFVLPKNGSCYSPDPIALLRGAPNREVAQWFIEYVHSEEGQDRIGFRSIAETKQKPLSLPDDPTTRRLRSHQPRYYALHRMPVRKDFYCDAKKPFQSSPDTNPFAKINDFVFQPTWTAPTFKAIRLLSKILFLDTYTELSKAWKAILDAKAAGRTQDAQRALALLENFEDLSYSWVLKELNPLLQSGNVRAQMQLETTLIQRFYRQYRQAFQLANGKFLKKLRND